MAPNFGNLHLILLTQFERGIKLTPNNNLTRCAIEMVECTLSSRVQGCSPTTELATGDCLKFRYAIEEMTTTETYYQGVSEVQISHRGKNYHHGGLLPGSV
jgi:hypothetical protein